jgi:iron complex outermembrane receptor protein
MKRFTMKGLLAVSASSAMMAAMMSTGAYAQNADEPTVEDEIITIGTRRTQRSAADTPAPVDVISGVEFTRNASNDVQDLLRTSVPSFNINTQPISDAASIVRPANLRGLSPDQTLVLVNGKRRHRGSVISFLGGGISDGAQGVDISAIPSIALKQVEVLRDGASSQYGSDAIAGVLNFVLKDAPEGGTFEAQYGSTYDGDGDNYRISGNVGLPLGDQGFVNLSAEYGEVGGTVRSIVRNDVNALIAAGNAAAGDFLTINTFTDEVPQYWGQPDVDDDFKFFLNSALQLTDNVELYSYANYSTRTVTGGFFYRNPTNRGGVYRGPTVDPLTGLESTADDAVASVRVGDLDGVGVGGECIDGIPLTGTNGLIQDATLFGVVAADPNCFAFTETIPGGFVPRFGGENEDYGVAFGLRGDIDLGDGLTYDLSVTHGSNKTDFFIRNTVNASLGPNTPRDFVPGGQQQTETVFNADFAYLLPTGLASDLSIAFGAEYREETFDLFAGDPASFALGPLADQGFSSSSNGFGGFPESSTSTQDSIGLYTELEADVTEQLTVQGALRYEDYSTFGDTIDYKIAALFKVTDGFRLRGSHSTGFHAPTAGQANIRNVTTQNVGGVLVDQGTLPLSSGAGQLAADFIEGRDGARPTLGPEDAEIFTAGMAFDLGPTSWTVDAYQIDVEDRIALGANINFLDALNAFRPTGDAAYTTVSEGITGLSNAGVITRSDFTGLEDLSQFRFFTNSFDTRTRGIDVVGRYPFSLGGGSSELTLAANYNETEVTDRGAEGSIQRISDTRVANLEDQLPNLKGFIQWSHTQDKLRGLLRANYFGEWQDVGNGTTEEFAKGAEILIDAELGYAITDGIEIIVGANNLFDNFPDVNPSAGSLGQLYPEAAPTGFTGGAYYTKLRVNF